MEYFLAKPFIEFLLSPVRYKFKVGIDHRIRFINLLNKSLVDLTYYRNSSKDTYAILELNIAEQQIAFLNVMNSNSFFKRKIKKAWRDYFGEEGEQDWWLPNEYSSILTNKLSNNHEHTRTIALSRIKNLISALS